MAQIEPGLRTRDGWFEEDCEVAIVFERWPELVDCPGGDKHRMHVRRVMARCYPERRIERRAPLPRLTP